MKTLYSSFAKWLVIKTNGSDEDFEIYRYGVQSGFEQGLFIITCILIALLINSLWAMLLFLIVFYLLRPYIGGFHFKEFWKCYVLSIISATSIVEIAKITFFTKTSAFLIYLLISGCICVYFFSKHSENQEDRYYKIKVLKNTFVIGMLLFLLILFDFKHEIASIIYSLAFCCISFFIMIKKSG